jgi:hypothetical protein
MTAFFWPIIVRGLIHFLNVISDIAAILKEDMATLFTEPALPGLFLD